jgi:DNA (cytosine-5)-methyltransferase 1
LGKENNEIRFVELFAGIGGFRYGLEWANRLFQEVGQEGFQSDNGEGFGSKRSGTGRHSQSNISSKQFQSQSGRRNKNKKKVSDKYSSIPTSECRINPIKFRCVWANEWNKYAAQVYRKQYGEIVTKDIRKIDADSIPDCDLLTAGFPCQTFSIAGLRKGFEETRGTLFFEIARITEAKRPRILLLENVKGLLSAQEGYCFYKILQTLDELGYDLQWQVLNSKHFGVPQNRERVFIIGCLRNSGFGEIFPIGYSGEKTDELQGLQVGAITSRRGTAGSDGDYIVEGDGKTQELRQIGNIDQKGHNSRWGRVYDPEGIGPTLHALGGGLGAKTGLVAMRWERTQKGKQARKDSKKVLGKDYTPFSDGHRQLVPSKEPVSGCVTGAINKDCLVGKDVANCVDRDAYLRTGKRPRDKDGKPQLLPIGHRRIRKLTPIECERLQGFPDNWTKIGVTKNGQEIDISDSQRYKMLGNAVTTNVICYLGQKIIGEELCLNG